MEDSQILPSIEGGLHAAWIHLWYSGKGRTMIPKTRSVITRGQPEGTGDEEASSWGDLWGDKDILIVAVVTETFVKLTDHRRVISTLKLCSSDSG